VLEKRKQIFDEVKRESLEYARSFIETDKYKELLISDLQRASQEIDLSHGIEVFLTQYDAERFEEDIRRIFSQSVNLCIDNELIGGFVILDKVESAKFDMSILQRINSAKDIIGEKLYELLQ
jgi:F0F1-type ATP synthase delta subunit